VQPSSLPCYARRFSSWLSSSNYATCLTKSSHENYLRSPILQSSKFDIYRFHRPVLPALDPFCTSKNLRKLETVHALLPSAANHRPEFSLRPFTKAQLLGETDVSPHRLRNEGSTRWIGINTEVMPAHDRLLQSAPCAPAAAQLMAPC
jgi:hypothetical protein